MLDFFFSVSFFSSSMMHSRGTCPSHCTTNSPSCTNEENRELRNHLDFERYTFDRVIIKPESIKASGAGGWTAGGLWSLHKPCAKQRLFVPTPYLRSRGRKNIKRGGGGLKLPSPIGESSSYVKATRALLCADSSARNNECNRFSALFFSLTKIIEWQTIDYQTHDFAI